ncbi:hypothetical protein [Mesorhizobium sp. Root172]|uniref:hypothetical protein n=1 Tax=Mesorhizobium sp. Root172 TaxID=1736481 RepID=UPI000A5F60EE|nr:hypothetical protein [Mesorhizobium sp. Root172]
MRAILTVALIGLASSAHAADPAKQKVINAMAMKLTLAYQCEPLTGDKQAYPAAKEAAAVDLAAAGVTDPSAGTMISAVEAQPRDSSKLTVALCHDLLATMK